MVEGHIILELTEELDSISDVHEYLLWIIHVAKLCSLQPTKSV